MKKWLLTGVQVLGITVFLVASLEALFFILGFPKGASRYTETVIIKEKLKTKKPENEYRIFAYGESTIHGSYYAPVSSPVLWLEQYLKDFLPGQKIKVVNFGRMGQGSECTYRALEETAQYKPDLAIFYLGHNGFLPKNRKDHVEAEQKKPGFILKRLYQESRFLSAVYRWFVAYKLASKTESVQDRIGFEEIETSPIGLPTNITPRSEPFYWDNLEFAKQNYIRIINFGRKENIRLLFMKPVGNLKDFAPYQSVHMKSLSPEQLKQWEEWYQKGVEAKERGDAAGATELLLKAHELDNSYAELSFRLGRLYFEQGDFERARPFFEEARDNDAVIVRATKDIIAIFEGLQKTRGLELVDTEKVLAPEVTGGILGEPVIEDNVHFSLKGHALTGRLIADEIAERNWIAPKSEWHFERERSYEEMEKAMGISLELQLKADLEMVGYFGSRFENRLRAAQKALEIDPDNVYAYRSLAWTYWLMNDKKKAAETYQQLNRIDHHAFQEVMKRIPDIRKYLDEEEKMMGLGPASVSGVGELRKWPTKF